MATLWRIGTDTPDYVAEDLKGIGAKITGGRWNSKGLPVVYTATSISLACLETVVHLDGTASLPLNRYLVRIEVPDAVAEQALQFDPDIAKGWDAMPPGRDSIGFGDHWLQKGESALLLVPSSIVPEELNVLINPAHPDAAFITATKVRKWLYDNRLKP